MLRRVVKCEGFNYLDNPTVEETNSVLFSHRLDISFYLGDEEEPHDIFLAYSMTEKVFREFLDKYGWGYQVPLEVVPGVMWCVRFFFKPDQDTPTKKSRLFLCSKKDFEIYLKFQDKKK